MLASRLAALVALAASVGGAVLTSCLKPSSYTCATAGDCVRAGAQGTCEPTGYCAFPDDTCPSHDRYDPSAGSYAGTCVGAAGPDAAADAPSGTPDAGGCAADRIPACHAVGGSTLPCDPTRFSDMDASFTLGMVVVGDYLLYAGGDGKIHRVHYDGLDDTSIAGSGSDSVGVASDGVNVYWGDYYDGVVRGAPVTSPFTAFTVTTLAQSPAFGRLAVHGGELFINSTDGVWMAKTDGSNPSPVKVASKTDGGDEDKSSGIAVDDTNVYWTDAGKVRRIPLLHVGNDTYIQDVASATAADNVALDADRVYWTSSEGLGWRSKLDGSGLTTISVNDTKARGLLLDGDYVYTDTPKGQILRIKKGGAQADLQLVAMGAANPYELAASCGAIYFGTFTYGNFGTVYQIHKP